MTKLDELIRVFSTLQGIGKKSAIRIAFDLLEKEKDEIEFFLNTVKTAYEEIRPCELCFTLTDEKICNVCSNENRDHSIICVVENTRDVFAFENAGGYSGIYHVLGGKIDPLNGVGTDELYIEELLKRLENVEEIILALNPDVEGETTTLYLSRLLANKNIRVSKIASGIPMGGNIEFADILTLTKSLEGRQELKDE